MIKDCQIEGGWFFFKNFVLPIQFKVFSPFFHKKIVKSFQEKLFVDTSVQAIQQWRWTELEPDPWAVLMTVFALPLQQV